MSSDREPTVPEDEELDLGDEDEEEFGEDMLVSLLTTEDGDTIPTILAGLAGSMDAIAKHLEKQNVILVKLLSALTAAKPPAPVHIAAPA
jgi:hypothetical protein